MPKTVKYVLLFAAVLLASAVCIVLMFRPRAVNIVYMADARYLPYVMVSLESAIASKNKGTQYHVHIIAKDFAPEDTAKIRKMAQDDVTIELYPAREPKLDYARLGRFSSFKISLQKLFIADYLPSLGKVLYLDADTLVQADLSEVYETDLRGKYAAAVKDGLMYQFPGHVADMDFGGREFYFNSGVMLLNLAQVRKDDIMRRAVIYFNTHNEVFGDQDVLNVVFGSKVVPLSYRYNCNSTFFEEKDAAFLSKFFNETVPQNPREVYDSAAILHFAGHKPWTPWFSHSYLKPLWYRYAAQVAEKYQMTF